MRPGESHMRADLNEWDDNIQYLFDLLQPPEWHKDALCKEHPEVNFFPERGDTRGWKAAKDICARCPVTDECYEAGRTAQEGIWGGLSAHARKKARPKRPRSECGTRAGFLRHRKSKQAPCEACSEAAREYNRAIRKKLAPCGTAAAYWRHKHRGETPCEPCFEAARLYEAAKRRRRGA